ncbi:MAG: ATPase, partial [Campylobacterota bacterium]|nr:ATPase [Campylobacterota bacterium]
MNFSVYLGSLLLKNQYYKLKELLELPKYNFKERYKVLWFTLMTLMQDEFPNEIKKMGSEF